MQLLVFIKMPTTAHSSRYIMAILNIGEKIGRFTVRNLIKSNYIYGGNPLKEIKSFKEWKS